MSDLSLFGLLLATQRSGTGALGSVLDQHAQLKYLGEIFHPDNIGDAGNYFTFFRDLVRDDPDRAMPWRLAENFHEFVEQKNARFPGKHIVIDIKYRSLHHLNQGWHGLSEMPWVIRYARQSKMPIIHLTRRNFLESFVSGRLAEANEIWHTSDPDAAKVKSVVINIRQMCNYIRGMEEEVNLMTRWTRGYDKLVHIDYGDMFGPAGDVKEIHTDVIAVAFSVDAFKNRAPSFVKQAPANLERSIENYELVKSALAGTPHEWMAP
ncbi:hypothetical protein [Nitratireductor sp. XY-223]|uniref:hypothetical protein n=1 Tax=Nitratireductor sp. XY-223 TaxID=2561926 RepID=UPI0010A9C446|nr:hypothetical protein [Nitratireductor sp. XY-223]